MRYLIFIVFVSCVGLTIELLYEWVRGRESLIFIVLFVGSFLFMFFPDRFGRHHFENWILSRPKPYVFNVLYFSLLGWMGYSIYKERIKGEEIGFGGFGDFLGEAGFYLFFYLSLLAIKRLEIDKKEKSNRIDYFKNKREQQKEWIEKSM